MNKPLLVFISAIAVALATCGETDAVLHGGAGARPRVGLASLLPHKAETPGPKAEKPPPAPEAPAAAQEEPQAVPEEPAAAADEPEKPKATIMDSLPGVDPIKKEPEKQAKPKREKKPLTGRDAIITAERTDYDRKQGVIFFDRNVYVDDEQYQLHADNLYVFLEGTNALKRIVALGNVAMTNEQRSASCAKASYNRETGKVVLYGTKDAPAVLRDEDGEAKEAAGERITFWLNSQEVNVENPVIRLPGSAVLGNGKNADIKGLLLGN